MPINLNIAVLVLDNSENFEWCLLGVSDLQKRMRVFKGSLAFLTKIKVRANSTFVTDSYNISFLAVITSNTFVNNNSLLKFHSGKFLFHLVKRGRGRFLFNDNRLIGKSRSL
jgi:hypothetical protein